MQLIAYNGFRCGTVPVAEIIVNGCLEQVGLNNYEERIAQLLNMA
jgi:hypothetical protein